MRLDAATGRYDFVTRILHWIVACLVFFAFASGLAADVPEKIWRPAWLNMHVLIGLSVAVLTIARLIRRGFYQPPPPLSNESPREIKIAKWGHYALYAMTILVPLIGFAPLFLRGKGVDFGLFQINSPRPRTPDLVGPATEIHELAAYALIALAVGHIAAALYHQFVRHDHILARMR